MLKLNISVETKMKSESIRNFELAMAIIVIMLIIMAVFCNLLIVVALTRPFHRRLFRDHILMVMVINDLILVLTGGSLEVRSLLTHSFDLSFCVFESFIVMFLEYMSIWFLFILVFDRYLTVCKPVAALQFHQQKSFALLCILTNILWSFLWAVMPVLGFGKYGLQNGKVQCGLIPNDDTEGKCYVILLMICIFAIPLFTMVILSRQIRQKFKQTNSIQNTTYGDVHEDDKSTMKFLILLVIAFTSAWLPYNIVTTVEILTDSPVSEEIEVTALCLAHSSAVAIPCISLLFYKELQNTVKRMVKNCFSRNTIEPQRLRISQQQNID